MEVRSGRLNAVGVWRVIQVWGRCGFLGSSGYNYVCQPFVLKVMETFEVKYGSKVAYFTGVRSSEWCYQLCTALAFRQMISILFLHKLQPSLLCWSSSLCVKPSISNHLPASPSACIHLSSTSHPSFHTRHPLFFSSRLSWSLISLSPPPPTRPSGSEDGAADLAAVHTPLLREKINSSPHVPEEF